MVSKIIIFEKKKFNSKDQYPQKCLIKLEMCTKYKSYLVLGETLR